MKVGVIGLGDLGVANVALFASFGFEVIAYDNNAFCVSLLNKGIKIFKDERIKDIISNNRDKIVFSNNIFDLSGISSIIISIELEYINDEYHLNNLYQTIDEIKKHFNWKTTLIIKTPLPIGTCRAIDKYLNGKKENFYIAYMPYIDLENNIYENTFLPKQTIVGTISQIAHMNVRILYEKFLLEGQNMYFVSYEEAEMNRVAQSFLYITCNQYIANMQCLYNEFNINFDTLLDTLEFPKVNLNIALGNSKKMIREYENLNLFLRKKYDFNKTLEESNLELAKYVVSKIPKGNQSIGLFGISDSFDEISELAINIIGILLKKANVSVVIFDQSNEENLKKIIGPNKKIKYALDEKSLVKKSNAILILCYNESFKSINEDFYLKYGRDDLIVCDFVGAYKYCKWQKVKLIKGYRNKKYSYKDSIEKEKAPQ
ncbi:MAG: hypothetical protein J1F31_01150 [Erysipelotrichales bacterium]|nr:hypothetical protein [Erysipelotrichales bacterium]